MRAADRKTWGLCSFQWMRVDRKGHKRACTQRQNPTHWRHAGVKQTNQAAPQPSRKQPTQLLTSELASLEKVGVR